MPSLKLSAKQSSAFTFHLGLSGVLLFVLSGQHMRHVLGVPELADFERLLFRTHHIYLLLTAIISVILGLLLKENLNKLQISAYGLMLLATPLQVASFILEPAEANLTRPLARSGLYLLFVSIALLVAIELYQWLMGNSPKE